MSEYKAGTSPLQDWKKEYRWTRDATRPTPEEIAAGKSDFKTTWRLFCKMDRQGAWLERRAIRAEASAAQLQAENDELSENLNRALNDNRAMIGKLEQAQAELHFFHGAFPQATRQYKALSECDSETPLGQELDGMGDEVQE